MSYYETLFIVHPALELGHLKDIVLSIEKSLKNMGGKTLSIDLWGKKRLAYLIDKQKYGTYVQLQFTGEGNCTGSFGMELGHDPNILAYLTTSIDEADVVEQKEDLDTQIAGQTREVIKIEEKSINEKNVSSGDVKGVDTQLDEKDTNEHAKNNPVEPAKSDEDEAVEDTPIREMGDEPQEKSSLEKNDQKNAGQTSAVSEKE